MKDERPNEPASDKTDELLEAARRRGRGLLDRQKGAAGEELHSVADVMREAARSFEERQEGGLAGYARKAAETLDRLSSTLRERDLDDLLSEAEGAFRRHPALGLAAAGLGGFVLGRFLKAGSKRLVSRGAEPARSEAPSERPASAELGGLPLPGGGTPEDDEHPCGS